MPFSFSRSQPDTKTPACLLSMHLASQWQKWGKASSPQLLKYALGLSFPTVKCK